MAPLNTVLIFILYKIGHADIYNWKHLIGENIIYLLYIHFTTVSASFLRSMLSDSFKEWFDYTVPFFPLVFTLVTMLLYYTSKNRKKKDNTQNETRNLSQNMASEGNFDP